VGRRRRDIRLALSLVRETIPLARTLRRLDADIVHSYLFRSILITRVAALFAGVPVRVSMETGPHPFENPVLRRWELATIWMDQRVISGSGYVAELLAGHGVPAGKIANIPFGADPGLFDRDGEHTPTVRAELGVEPNTPLVGNVAYFYGALSDVAGRPNDGTRGFKGQEDFVDAARIVHDVRPDVRFVLVGDGFGVHGVAQYERVRQQVSDLGLDGIVLFAGQRPQVADLIAALDVSVQCPLLDNYGGTFESLLMEAPTIATRVGPMAEVIRHEETGLLVPPADPAALAAAMIRLIDDPEFARKLARAGRQLVLDEFTMDKTIDRIDLLYRELARDAGLSAPPLA
jgi:glycosyltransferase involved in cell wall biosynthesis